MKLLIAGGAGCLGCNLTEHWAAAGHDILIIDNFKTGNAEAVPVAHNVSLVEGDISNFDHLDRLVAAFKPNVMINSAASYSDPLDWDSDIATNIIGSKNLALVADRHAIERIINFQTALVYGEPNQLPIPRHHQNAPSTSYGISKLAGEQYLLKSESRVLSLRLANITGPRLSIGPIPTFYQRLKEKKRCFCTKSKRDFLDMGDFLSFMDLALLNNVSSGIYNLSSGEAHSVKEIYELVCEHFGMDASDVEEREVEEDDFEEICLDYSETEQEFSWRPEVSFTQQIKNQLSWYDKFGVSEIYSHLVTSHSGADNEQ